MTLRPIRRYTGTDTYHYTVDNQPVDDIEVNLQMLATLIEGMQSQIADILDDKAASTIVHVGSDALIQPELIPSHPIDIHSDTTEKVVMSSDERIKLGNITPGANVFEMRTGNTGQFLDGQIQIEGGTTVRVVQVPSTTSVKRVRIDTIFPPDRLHEHRFNQLVTRIENNVGYVPSGEEYISGTLQLFKNGIALDPQEYAEKVDIVTGKRNQFQFAVGFAYDYNIHRVTASYEIKPSSNALFPDPALVSIGKPTVKTWVRNAGLDQPDGPERLVDVVVVIDGASHLLPPIWLIPLDDLAIKTPYELFKLFVNGQLVYYGHDWDIVAYGGATYIRWRFGLDDYTTAWLSETSSTFAQWDLDTGFELVLYCYTSWEE